MRTARRAAVSLSGGRWRANGSRRTPPGGRVVTGGRQVVRMGRRSLVAFAAAWLLLLQVALTGLTAFAHPGSAQAEPDLAGAPGFAAVIFPPYGAPPAPAASRTEERRQGKEEGRKC